MYKKIILFFACCFSIGIAMAQKKGQPLLFDVNAFNENAATARWLYTYDKVAWWTTDSIVNQPQELLDGLGKEWFCYQDSQKTWHAVYGNYEFGSYRQILHFLVDTDARISSTLARVDTNICYPFSRAINTAYREAWPVIDSAGLRFNHYVRFLGSDSIEVFLFPAFQPDNFAVFGGEFVYTLDRTGTKVLEDRSYFQGSFRGFKTDTPRNIVLDYTEREEPTLGGIFFLWYYKKYFTQIYLKNTRYSHTLYKNEKGQYSWLHLENPKEKAPKKK